MNRKDENQHWVSRVVLKRFKMPGKPLQCYQVQTGDWQEKSLERVCAWAGYNQVLEGGQSDNTIEGIFSGVESKLQKTFRALEEASNRPVTELPRDTYENMCRYCALLKLLAPYSKPGAVVSFVMQINMELESGQYSLIRELELPEREINALRMEHAAGRRVIIDAENALQTFYRYQLQRCYNLDYSLLARAEWTVSISALEMPLPDIGLVPMSVANPPGMHHVLPISPNIVLDGFLRYDLARDSCRPVVKGHALTPEQAEYRFDCICASAISELICARRISEIPTGISRARSKGIAFCKVPNLESITSAGLKVSSRDFFFRVVSVDEYTDFIHSLMKPPSSVVRVDSRQSSGSALDT